MNGWGDVSPMGDRQTGRIGALRPRGKAAPDADDPRRCQARSKQNRRRCRRWACPGRRVCAMHGGKTPFGIASPNFRHGRYSRGLPARLEESYLESLSNPDSLSNRETIALLDTLIWDRIGQLPDERPVTAEEREEDYRAWREIRELTEAKTKAVLVEIRSLCLSRDMITREQGMALVAFILASVRRRVTDRATLALIREDFRQALNRPDSRPLPRDCRPDLTVEEILGDFTAAIAVAE